jgi:hypothetical protein
MYVFLRNEGFVWLEELAGPSLFCEHGLYLALQFSILEA